MSSFKLELSKVDGKYKLTSKYTKAVAKSESFKSECKKAAEALYKKNKKSGIVLFLENSFESLVLLETFLEIGAMFEVATLSCGRLSSTVVTKWKSRLDALNIKLHDVRFDFESTEHMTALEALRQQFDVTNILSLFKIWAACNFDQFVIFPGDICIPEIDSTDKIVSWGLPGTEQVAFYNFSKSFDLEPFFICSTHGLFKAQVESDFASAYFELHKSESRGFPYGNFEAKKIWYDHCGWTKLSKWPVTEEQEPIWKSGLRFEDRNPNEKISILINRTRQVLMYEVFAKHEGGPSEPKKFNKRKEKMARIGRKLKAVSSDLLNVGAIVPVSKVKNDAVYGAFPLLFTEHFFEGSLKQELEYTKQIRFYPNMKNLISANDLHLKPELKRLAEFFNEKIKKYFETQSYIVNDFEILQCWANRSKANMDHHPHQHPNSFVSGVFYFNDGDGDTEFYKEVLESDVVRPSASKHSIFNAKTFRVRPEFGKLVLFPSHLHHRVLVHQSESEDRITIAFNVFVRGVIGEFNEGGWVDLRMPATKIKKEV